MKGFSQLQLKPEVNSWPVVGLGRSSELRPGQVAQLTLCRQLENAVFEAGPCGAERIVPHVSHLRELGLV